MTVIFMFAAESCSEASVCGQYLHVFLLIHPAEVPRPLESSYQLITSKDILVIHSVLLTAVRGQQAVGGNTVVEKVKHWKSLIHYTNIQFKVSIQSAWIANADLKNLIFSSVIHHYLKRRC